MKRCEYLLRDVLYQSCSDENGMIDTQGLSVYEEACSYLEKKKILRKFNDRLYVVAMWNIGKDKIDKKI